MKKISSIILSVEMLLCCGACRTGEVVKESITETKQIISESQSALEEARSTIKEYEQTIKDIEVYIPKTSIKTTTKRYSDPYIKKNLGTFTLTFYVADAKWGYNTSTGARSTHLKTCAVDPSVIPYGSVIKINGNNGQTIILKAVDCGGGIVGNKIDIFWDKSISEGYAWMAEFGTVHNVYLLEE